MGWGEREGMEKGSFPQFHDYSWHTKMLAIYGPYNECGIFINGTGMRFLLNKVQKYDTLLAQCFVVYKGLPHCTCIF